MKNLTNALLFSALSMPLAIHCGNQESGYFTKTMSDMFFDIDNDTSSNDSPSPIFNFDSQPSHPATLADNDHASLQQEPSLKQELSLDDSLSFENEYNNIKKDGAGRHQRKLAYKHRDRYKNNPYSRDIHDEDDSVKTQNRIAKILWAASSHPSAQAHAHIKDGHGKRAYAQYINNLPQQNLSQQDTHYKTPTLNQEARYISPRPDHSHHKSSAGSSMGVYVTSTPAQNNVSGIPGSTSRFNPIDIIPMLLIVTINPHPSDTSQVMSNILSMRGTGVDNNRLARISGHFIENGKVSK